MSPNTHLMHIRSSSPLHNPILLRIQKWFNNRTPNNVVGIATYIEARTKLLADDIILIYKEESNPDLDFILSFIFSDISTWTRDCIAIHLRRYHSVID